MSRVFLSLLAALALALPTVQSVHAGEVPKPVVKIENPGQCVAPREEMRRDHMEMLKHQRDRTMRLGERGAKVTLNGCIECHAASKTNGSVLGGKDGFCESCHAYAAVKLDCWDCHQPKANYKAASAAPTMGLKP